MECPLFKEDKIEATFVGLLEITLTGTVFEMVSVLF